MDGLPIDAIRESFQEGLHKGRLVVQAPTGSGKSTRLPLWLTKAGRVLVVEPRRMACRALAAHVASLKGTSLGQEVGYAIRFVQCCSEKTRIVFATPGIALRWYAEDGLHSFDAVFLDEFHERRWDTDLLAAVLRSGEHCLVLASATVDGPELATYLDGGLLHAEGRSHPVTTTYTEEHRLPSLQGLNERIVRAVRTGLVQEDEGDILVFLPGKGEIRDAQAALRQGNLGVPVVPLHAGTAAAEQDGVLQPSQHRRIILATNVAETSLTLPGVRVVVDSGLERRTQRYGGRTVLALQAISQAAADQRAGRAGRLGPGQCFRLWGRQARLKDFTAPEIQREDLTELVLASHACGSPPETLEFPTSLPSEPFETARQRARAMGGIDSSGQLTPHGQALFTLPLDPFFAHLVAVVDDAALRRASIDIAAALEAPGGLLPAQQTAEGREALARFAPEPCDAWTLLRLMRHDPPSEVFCKYNDLAAARETARRIRHHLDLPTNVEAEALPVRSEWLLAMLRNAPEAAFIRRGQIKRREALVNGQGFELTASNSSRFADPAEAALVLAIHSLPGTKGTQQSCSRGTCLAPLPLALLRQAGIGTEVPGQPAWEDGRVSVLYRHEFAGRVLEETRRYPEGSLLRQAVAHLLCAGQLWRESGKRLLEDIQAWNLYCALGKSQGDAVVPEQWVEHELETLGLEAQEDLAVLAPQDLVFEGIPSWERAGFDRRYPRLLDLEGMRISIDYDVAHSRITLEKIHGPRKTPPTRRELPPWGRNWTVRFRAASKVVLV